MELFIGFGRSCLYCIVIGAALTIASGSSEGPGSGPWVVDFPENQGLDSKRVHQSARHLLQNAEAATRDCYVVIKDGVLAYEEYSSAGYNNTPHMGNSITKTLGALLIGWATSRRLLDLDADITKAYGVRSPRPYPVTTRQVMSQALAGISGPGEEWGYDTTGANWLYVLPIVFFKATGRSPVDVWQNEFVKPLGLSNQFSWQGVDISWAAGSEGTCRDYARVGQLMLNGGSWKGVPSGIVNEAYLQEMRTPQTRYAPFHEYTNPCYGLLTWLNTNPGSDRGSSRYPGVCQMWPRRTWFPAGAPSDIYLASGILGELIVIVPSQRLVVVSMGSTPDDYPVDRVVGESICIMLPAACRAALVDATFERPLAI